MSLARSPVLYTMIYSSTHQEPPSNNNHPWIASSRAPKKTMESLVQNNVTAISNMSDADKRDLQKSVNNEMQKMKIQEGDEKLPKGPPSPLPPPPKKKTKEKKKMTVCGFVFSSQLSLFANISRGSLQRCTTLQTYASKNA